MSPKLLNILLILIAGSLYYFVANPLYTGVGDLYTPDGGGIVSLRIQRAKNELALSKVQSIADSAEALKKEYSTISDKERAMLDVMIPDQIDRTRLLSELTGMISDFNLPIKDLQVTEVKSFDSRDLGAYDVTFRVQSSYESFKETINYFDYSKRLYTLNSLKTAAPSGNDTDMTFEVALRTYYLK